MPSLEEALASNTAALEANTKALIALASGPAETKKKTKGETAAPAEPAATAAPAGPSLQDIRDAAAKIVDAKEGKKIEEIAKKHGFARCSAAHGTDKAQVVYDELLAVLKDIEAKANL